MVSKSKPDEFDAELDLLERYSRMVTVQIETLESVDEKAAKVARLISVLLGLLLSALSFLASTSVSVQIQATALLTLVTVSATAYVTSLLYAILTYLSSSFEYGPVPGLGTFMAQYNVPDREYLNSMLAGYAETVARNKRVVITNARRFQRCLAVLLVGVVNTTGSVVLLLVGPKSVFGYFVMTVSLVLSGAAGLYVVREEYLTIERGHPDDG